MTPGYFLALLLFTPMSASTGNTGLQWQNDYPAAMIQAEELNRPLLVVIGYGDEGWKQVVQAAATEPAVRELLASKCVCLYLDRNDVCMKDYADRFDASNQPFVALSDRSRQRQVYRHAGPVAANDLRAAVENPSVSVRTANYQAPGTVAPAAGCPCQPCCNDCCVPCGPNCGCQPMPIGR